MSLFTKDDDLLNQQFWQQRWEKEETGWDIGYASPPIVEYMEQVADKGIKILIPGCGNAYEAKALAELGFTDITLLDIAPKLVEKLKKELSLYPAIKIICDDFFLHKGKYDLILEQTFFCALQPWKRESYVEKCFDLLERKGKVVGVLFNREFEKAGPPFGGSRDEYVHLFEPYFHLKTMGECRNSIAPRAGSELFIILERKDGSDLPNPL